MALFNIRSEDTQRLVSAYDGQIKLYEALKNNSINLLANLLHSAGIKCHQIEGRVKTRKSFIEKITVRAKHEYLSLSEITDICGVRITTYFAGDIDIVAKLIESLFVVDLDNSIDKRNPSDPTSFGYQSKHFVVELPTGFTANRSQEDLTALAGLKVEIQLRSILQHAWAEIEHDLGYKSPNSVSSEIRRDFSMISAQLRAIDFQFDVLRVKLTEYENSVKSDSLAERHQEINAFTMKHFLETNASVTELNNRVLAVANATQMITEPPIEKYLLCTKVLKVNDILDLRGKIADRVEDVKKFIDLWFENPISRRYSTFPKGIGFLFYFYTDVASSRDAARVLADLSAIGVPARNLEETAKMFATIADQM
jgi:putative GTP pyrophosphokinase